MKPSERIRPSMMAMRITKKNGQVMMGRVVNSDEKQISLMLIGNQVVQIARKDIGKTENDPTSLMYTGLISSLTDSQKDALLDYLVSLSN